MHLFIEPGGLLLFDVNTPDKLRRMDGQVLLDETEDVYCVWRTVFSAQPICTYRWICFPAAGRRVGAGA